MPKKIITVIKIGLFITFSAFISGTARAQFSDPVIQSFYNRLGQSNIIGQMRALQSINQRPADYNNNNTNNNTRYFQTTISPEELARRQRLNEATAANNKGLDFYNNQDWVNAVISFQEAADKNPDDKVIQDNLAKAKFRLQVQQDEQARIKQQAQQNKVAVGNMQQTVQTFTQTLNAIPSSGALDFDHQHSASANGNSLGFMSNGSNSVQTTAPVLQFGDPTVVNGQKVPSGLPKDVENSIPATPAGDRVRKGLQAIQDHDWKVALAWFQDALNKQPGDPGLARLVDLAQFTLQKQSQTPAIKQPEETEEQLVNRVIDDYNRNNLSLHPELKDKPPPTENDPKEDPAWIQFFKYIDSKIPNPRSTIDRRPGSVAGVRG